VYPAGLIRHYNISGVLLLALRKITHWPFLIATFSRGDGFGNVISRVTRLGEFLPYGRLFSLGSFLKMIKVAQIIGLLFSTGQDRYDFGHKMGWAFFTKNAYSGKN
jgi:hypothetical protein